MKNSIISVLVLALSAWAGIARADTANEQSHYSNVQLFSLTGATPPIADTAPATEFAMSVGYAHLAIGGSSSEIHDEGQLRLEPSIMVAPFERLPQLRFGAACGFGMVFDNTSLRIVSSGGVTITGKSSIPLYTLEPELRLSWRQYIGERRTFFIEPGVGVGIVYASLNFDSDSGESYDESDTAVTGRGYINIGTRVANGAAGVQASYMRGDSMELAQNVKGEVNQFYIGIFGSLRF